MSDITASPDTLMRQAPETAKLYMIEAVEAIDEVFGEGFAGQHPELVAAFMRVSATDFACAIAAKTRGQATEELGESIRRVCDSIELVASALSEIATQVEFAK